MRPLRNSPVKSTGSDSPRGKPLTNRSLLGDFKGVESQKLPLIKTCENQVWPFVFDTIFTFFRRLKNRENVFAAHRSHLYQRLVIAGYSHRTVTLIYMGLDVMGLLFALLFLLKNAWVDLCVIITLLLSSFGLWGFTVVREQSILQTKNSNGALEEKLI